MFTRFNTVLLYLMGAVAVTPAFERAYSDSSEKCLLDPPGPFAGLPFELYDSRSGLRLYIERDGRHITATDRDGTVVWRRNPFVDDRLELYGPPPIALPGEKPHPIPRSYYDHLRVDRINVISDCAAKFFWKAYPQVRGYYVYVGVGTKFEGFLDAKTGAFSIVKVN